jgi:hypothetical protein
MGYLNRDPLWVLLSIHVLDRVIWHRQRSFLSNDLTIPRALITFSTRLTVRTFYSWYRVNLLKQFSTYPSIQNMASCVCFYLRSLGARNSGLGFDVKLRLPRNLVEFSRNRTQRTSVHAVRTYSLQWNEPQPGMSYSPSSASDGRLFFTRERHCISRKGTRPTE